MITVTETITVTTTTDDSYGWQDYNDYNNDGYYGEQY